MNQSMFSITYTKSFEVKPQFDRLKGRDGGLEGG